MKTSEKPLWYSSNASSYINIVLLVSSIVKIFYVFYSKFQNSESTNFMEILNERLDLKGMGRQFNVTTIMNSWTRQPSYPIVRCTRIANGRIRLSQMPHPGLLDGNHAQLWWIPLAMTDGKQPDFSPDGMFPRVWLSPGIPTMEIPYFPPGKDENTWILINPEMSSYIRVLYDERNLKLIARQLMRNYTVIPPVTRTQLIDDAFTLAMMQHIDYNVVLKLISYLTVFKDEFVRETVTSHVDWMLEKHNSHRNETLHHIFKVCHHQGGYRFEYSTYNAF